MNCGAHQIEAERHTRGFEVNCNVLSEDYKQYHCCVNFCSNDKRNKSGENLSFFNFPIISIEIEMDCRYMQDEWPDFEVRKNRVVTNELLDARVISDRLYLSIEDSQLTNSLLVTTRLLLKNAALHLALWRQSISISINHSEER